MTGVERNSQQVAMAAFAPLLSHWNDRACPHNMIIFDNRRYVHTHVQAATLSLVYTQGMMMVHPQSVLLMLQLCMGLGSTLCLCSCLMC